VPDERPLRLLALEAARDELRAGAGEEGGNNRGPAVARYLAATGLVEGYAWCTAFVSWCFKRAAAQRGVPMPFPYTAGALNLWRWGLEHGWRVDSPLPGDIVIWSRGLPGSGLGHAGLVEYASPDKQVFQTIEGNRSPFVARFRYNRRLMLRLKGYLRVPG
jgi:hypothetical protein